MKKLISLLFLFVVFATNAQTQGSPMPFGPRILNTNEVSLNDFERIPVMYDNGQIVDWVHKDSIGGGSTPTLSEVLAEGNVADDNQYFTLLTNSLSQETTSYSGSGMNVGDNDTKSTMYGLGGITSQNNNNLQIERQVIISYDNSPDGIFIQDDITQRGLVGAGYYGANYTDNTYVQKKYVDDAIDAIPTPNLTLEQARQNGNVLEGDIEFENEMGTTIKITSPYEYGQIDLFNLDENRELSLTAMGIGFKDDALNSMGFSFNYNFENILVTGSDTSFKGLVGSNEFDKQGDRNAFAQIADVEDAINDLVIPEELTAGEGIDITNDEISVKAATDLEIGGVKIWKGTQVAYNAISTYDPNTLYFIEDLSNFSNMRVYHINTDIVIPTGAFDISIFDIRPPGINIVGAVNWEITWKESANDLKKLSNLSDLENLEIFDNPLGLPTFRNRLIGTNNGSSSVTILETQSPKLILYYYNEAS